MSLKTLPLLFINLGGEMMYILDQRLKAQNIPPDKGVRVMHDIVSTMFNKRFMEELFKPQELYSKKAMRTVFDRLAHASIMRLNAASMDKLYDLMTMAFKYQVSLCTQPKVILLVTMNHMDAIISYVKTAPAIRSQVEGVYKLMIENYVSLMHGDLLLIRQTLLNFFEDMHIRVSIFLKDGVQSSNGHFMLPTYGAVPYGTESPGMIRSFKSNGDVTTSYFQTGGKYGNSCTEGSYALTGDRVTKLGTNMYSIVRPIELPSPVKQNAQTALRKQSSESYTPEVNVPNPLAKAQLDLLHHLIRGGGEKQSSNSAEFRLNLFNTDEEEDEHASISQSTSVSSVDENDVLRIEAKKKSSEELSRIMSELNADETNDNADEDDLLDLLDKA